MSQLSTLFGLLLIVFPIAVTLLGLQQDKGRVTIWIKTAKISLPKYTTSSSWHWSLNMTFMGMIGGVPGLVLFISYTVLSTDTVLLIILALSAAGLYIWRTLLKTKVLDLKMYLLYCVFGWGIWGTNLILGLNYFIPIETGREETHYIASMELKRVRTKSGSGEVWAYKLELDDHSYASAWWFLTYNAYTAPDDLRPEKQLHMTVRRGIFGMVTLKDYSFH